MEGKVLLPEPMYFIEVMEHADDSIGSLTSFIDEVLDVAEPHSTPKIALFLEYMGPGCWGSLGYWAMSKD